MILELCQHAQEYLRKYNLPPKSSFYEEMMENQRKFQEMKAKEKQQQLELQIQAQQKQVRIKQYTYSKYWRRFE